MTALMFKKKPVVVEAVRFTGENINELGAFCKTHRDSGDQWDIGTFNCPPAYNTWGDPNIIAEVWDTLHSTWVGVKAGQWIIKGVKGEFYPCDAEVFIDTYDEI